MEATHSREKGTHEEAERAYGKALILEPPLWWGTPQPLTPPLIPGLCPSRCHAKIASPEIATESNA